MKKLLLLFICSVILMSCGAPPESKKKTSNTEVEKLKEDITVLEYNIEVHKEIGNKNEKLIKGYEGLIKRYEEMIMRCMGRLADYEEPKQNSYYD
jgi:predicted transcriptional regulator